MAVVEVTTESWFSRLIKSIKSVLVGLLLFVVSFPLLFWNEGRAVQTAKSLDEGAGAVVSVKSDAVDASKEGKLVHMSGEMKTEDTLKDPDFAVSEKAIKLYRDVEMYQWVEKKTEKEEKQVGGSVKTTTTYSYERDWEDKVIDSSDFREDGHDNPTAMPYQAVTLEAQKVTLGAFTLTSAQLSQVTDTENLAVTDNAVEGVGRAKVNSGGVYVGADPSSPRIGDVRVNWRVVRPGPLSVVGVQLGSTFGAYQASAGDALLLVDQGTLTAAQMFQKAQDENAMMTWILRALGWFLMFVGLLMVFKPISVFGDVIPLFGSMLGAGLGLFAFLLSAGLSLLTVAVAWVVVRPVLGVGMLVVALGAIVGLFMLSRKRSAAKAAA